MNGYLERVAKDWKDIDRLFFSQFGKEQWVFRGQSSATWSLRSSFDRLIGQKDDPTPQEMVSHERMLVWHLSKFRDYCKGKRGSNPTLLTDVEMLSLGQHWGLATNFLDWSESPFLALFFAFQNPRSDDHPRALWAVHREAASSLMGSVSSEFRESMRWPEDAPADQLSALHFGSYLTDENSRQVTQRGLFSRLRGGGALEMLVKKRQPQDLTLCKIVIANNLRTEIIERLARMNIEPVTIFPDLEGAAKSTNMLTLRRAGPAPSSPTPAETNTLPDSPTESPKTA